MAEAGKVLFHLTDDALIVANSGKQFTRDGVIAICHMHLSEKTGKPEDSYDKDLIRAIAKFTIDKYCVPNALSSDAGGEEALGKDQYGRFVWELLQNADDAATRSEENIPSEFIGAKGLGFRSILEISNSPEIYSGNFSFRFSREDSRRMLINNGVSVENGVPAFSIPHPCKPDGKCAAFLKGGYSTVIRLPFADDKVKEAEKQLGKLDASCLLFCQRLFRIEIEIRGESRIIELDRDGIFGFKQGKATFTLQENNEIQKWRRWSVAWSPKNNTNKKQLSAALCLPMGENGEIATGEERPVHVFFPTAEVCVPGLKALLHASYNLQSNREHFDRDQPHGEAIRDKIGGLASEILADIPPIAALRAFGEIPSTKNNANKTEIEQLQNAFASAVAQTSFVPIIGGEKVKPAEARIWKHGLGSILCEQHPNVREAKLLIPSLSAEPEVRGILAKLEAKHVALHEHAKLLQSCQSDTLHACHAAWQVAGDIACEANKNTGPEHIQPDRRQEANTALVKLKEAPIWWTEAESSRPLNGDIPLLQERPREWPKWLKTDALSPKFQKLLGGAAKKAGDPLTPVDSLRKSGIWPLHNEHSYFTGALLPFCEGIDSEQWEEMGWDVLQWAFRWGSGEVSKLPPSIIGDGNKINRIDESLIHLPTDKGWLPAIQCYAGNDWGGPAGLDKYFQARKDRPGILMPFEEWKLPPEMHGDKKKWERFLRGLGASWGLKIRRVSLNDLPKNLADLIGEYKQQHLTKIKRWHSSATCVNGGESTFIEDFPDVLAECRPADAFRAVKSVEQLAKETGKTRLEYEYRQGTEKTNPAESFALFQLRQSEWVPCWPGLYDSVDGGDKLVRVRPGCAFMPECELKKIVPVVRKPDGISPDEWGSIYGALKALGVRTEKPASTDKEWWRIQMNQLAKITEELETENEKMRWSLNKNGEISNVMRYLYTAYGDSLSDMGNVPYISMTNKGEFVVFGPLRDVHWADKSHHEDADVRRSLLSSGEFKLFPFFLRNGRAFGVQPLSDFVDEKPNASESPDMTKTIQLRFKSRREMLALVAGKPINASEFAEEFAEKIKGCDKLTLILKRRNDGKKIAEPQIDFYMGESELLVNGGGNKWRALAAGIAAWCKIPQKAAIFEGLLCEDENEKGYDECCKRLRQLGISEDELTPPPTEESLDLSGPVISPSNGEKPKIPNNREQPPNIGEKEKHLNLGPQNSKGGRVGGHVRRGGGGGDPEIRQQIEYTAVKVVREYYQGKGYEVVSVEDDNMGWDLNVFPPDGETLQVEVKGISKHKVNVGLTPNEYSKSGDEGYYLAIVRDALSDNPACAIYKRDGDIWRWQEGDDENAPKQLVTEEKTGASVKEKKF